MRRRLCDYYIMCSVTALRQLQVSEISVKKKK